MIDVLADAAGTWAEWMWRGLVDGSWVCALALALWLPFRKRAPAQLGYGLFLLVLLKLAFPLEFTVPTWLMSWLPAAWLPTVENLAVVHSPMADALPASLPVALQVSLETVLFVVWIVVAAVLLIRLAWIQARTAEIARRSRPIEAGELPVDFDKLQALAGMRTKVRFLACERVHSPAAGGLFRPYVLLPMELCREIPREPLSWVLLHELAHLRRGDLWVSLLQRIVQVVFFFHPAVWLANWIVDEQREFACDEFALRVSKAPRRECGEGFLSIVEWSQQHPQDAVATLGMFDSKSVIRRRLMRILNGKGADRSFGARLCTTLVVLIGLLVVPTPKLEAAAPQDPKRAKEIREQLRELESIKRGLVKELEKSEGGKSGAWRRSSEEQKPQWAVPKAGTRYEAAKRRYEINRKRADFESARSLYKTRLPRTGASSPRRASGGLYAPRQADAAPDPVRTRSGGWATQRRNSGSPWTGGVGTGVSVPQPSRSANPFAGSPRPPAAPKVDAPRAGLPRAGGLRLDVPRADFPRVEAPRPGALRVDVPRPNLQRPSIGVKVRSREPVRSTDVGRTRTEAPRNLRRQGGVRKSSESYSVRTPPKDSSRRSWSGGRANPYSGLVPTRRRGSVGYRSSKTDTAGSVRSEGRAESGQRRSRSGGSFYPGMAPKASSVHPQRSAPKSKSKSKSTKFTFRIEGEGEITGNGEIVSKPDAPVRLSLVPVVRGSDLTVEMVEGLVVPVAPLAPPAPAPAKRVKLRKLN